MFGGHDNAAQPPEDTSTAAASATPADATADPATLGGTPASAPALDTAGFLPTPSDPAAAPDTTGAPAVAPIITGDVSNEDDLLSIKQQALQQLSPLVGQLDQAPEDKFRTTMMMIQASDNQGLIKEAFAAAQQIADEKVRAQALLDIVNEINYFTQASQPTDTETNAAA